MCNRILSVLTLLTALSLAWPDLTRPVLTGKDGERYVAGQIIIELKPHLRGRVQLSNQDGLAFFGVPALDELSNRLAVDDITPLTPHPSPHPALVELGCDLQYSVQFRPEFDVYEACSMYARLEEVDYACPNAVLQLDNIPNDPGYVNQWHLAKLGAPFAWKIAKGSASVVSTVIDDGLDWQHPDIEANLRIKAAEDINNNGRFDPSPPPSGDLDNIDQDGNGYRDDVIGWDFISGDPNPAPNTGDDHGTHCWGITNAVTNNATGVAGTTWNTRSIVCRAGYGGSIYLSQATSAIQYATNERIWSISMSFGGSSVYTPMRDACLAAWNAGLVLFGSAGNEGLENMRYPACYAGVENVAASNNSDVKASWSNYGTWVDVTAPGVSIYSTVSRSSGSYSSMDGTSMACPLAAGVACWLKSLDPSLTNVACTARMHAACDTMPDPLYRQGKLGAGRVSLANLVLKQYYCDLRLTSWRFNDASGNRNGRPDPGETVALIVTYSNTAGYRNASNISANLATTSPWVTITKNTATFPPIPAGSSGNCSADSFVITVRPDAPPQNVRFFLTVTATPYAAYPDTSFSALAGEPRVLLVDDDLDKDYEKWYTSACDSNGIVYHTYNVRNLGSPSADTLRRYPVVIWFTGDDSLTTLTTNDIVSLVNYLDNGGKLIISGKNIAQNLSSHWFLSDYLRAELVTGSTGKLYLPGIPGDPITQGDTMVAGGGSGANNGSSLDGVKAINGGTGCAFFKDYGDPTVYSVIRYQGTYRLVYFSVPFEAINHSSRYLQRWTLLKRIFRWFDEPLVGAAEPAPSPFLRPYVLEIAPNPLSRNATVSFISPVNGRAELRICALDGRVHATYTRDVALGQEVRFPLNRASLPAGCYLVQLVTPEGVFAQKMAVVR